LILKIEAKKFPTRVVVGAKQDAGAARTFGAAGKEHVETKLGDVLRLALGGRVVDGDGGVVDEASERGLAGGAMILTQPLRRAAQRAATRTDFRRGRSVSAMASLHRSLVANARRCTASRPRVGVACEAAR
jgi:hypothetical protein